MEKEKESERERRERERDIDRYFSDIGWIISRYKYIGIRKIQAVLHNKCLPNKSFFSSKAAIEERILIKQIHIPLITKYIKYITKYTVCPMFPNK